MDWRDEVADQVTGLFQDANKKTIPLSLREWADVAERFQRDLYIAPRHMEGQRNGVIQDDIIVVRGSRDPEMVSLRVAHELTEYLLRSTWDSPYVYQSDEADAAEIHRIAQMIEARSEAERESLRQQADETEAMVAGLRGQLSRFAADVQAFTLAAAEGRDTTDLPLPNKSSLMRVAGELRQHSERLTMIQARLRCI